MSNLKSSENPEVRYAKLMAELYYFMAHEMVERMGNENGSEAISSAINKFGEARVKAMKAEAKERGLDEDDIKTYAAVRDMPSTGWKHSDNNPLEITYCPMEDIWSQYGKAGMEVGHLYCDIDNILFESFGMKLERPYCIAKGDKVCKFNLKKL
ncbi:hypothetical protein Ccar_05910 [Clostridium carboxidivorans P7]|uniref:L-2-amino-thiazoline-4-carboxylic acid hydrolase n=1 Tax=Clostridium carboxidivorans P7 TaxID=536227 RepID=C6Q193_9CLOT|nr:L-2-amino-thiazoline-4-carboxylic acid hydrolase [Clostridium carboxidivorans]AKN30379.1 hypothetical protein Ccar_05910 [Clostridium carboxidivorans P7]EET84731.1 hypothetical protein CcarbDRAFT_4810 [Clostridium carboxidivorans P7]